MNVLRWLSKTVLMMVFVCLLTVVTTLLVMKSYTEQVLGEIGMQFENGQLTLPQWLSPIAGQGNNIDSSKVRTERASEGMPSDYSPDDHAIEVWRQGTQHVVVPLEAFEELKSQLSSEAKAEIFSIIMGSVPFDVMQQLSEMMEDGITLEELQHIEQMMKIYLSEVEYDKLMTLLNF